MELFEVNDIVTVVTGVGEIIGRVQELDKHHITIKDPRTIIVSEQGATFAPGICLSGKREPSAVTLEWSNVVFALTTDENIANKWIQATSGIIV
jgi:hypothetical protein